MRLLHQTVLFSFFSAYNDQDDEIASGDEEEDEGRDDEEEEDDLPCSEHSATDGIQNFDQPASDWTTSGTGADREEASTDVYCQQETGQHHRSNE